MNLTALQVRERLHIGEARLKKLVKEGVLTPINPKKEGAKKFFMKFREGDVIRVKKELKIRKPPVLVQTEAPSDTPLGSGIRTQLDRIEAKLDQIIKLWS